MRVEVIKIPEQFSVTEASEFREMTYNLMKVDQITFELDFSNCNFIDSTGLGVLVGLYKKCNETHSKMILKHLKKDVARVISMTRLDQIFTIL
ncbi:MAG: hypothetical protein BGO41_04365 [Clostridiales bacterium 38-18]|nr:MAG: hypothetical protein BGO41_04365 [Clostridiales bacterium 38-18]